MLHFEFSVFLIHFTGCTQKNNLLYRNNKEDNDLAILSLYSLTPNSADCTLQNSSLLHKMHSFRRGIFPKKTTQTQPGFCRDNTLLIAL